MIEKAFDIIRKKGLSYFEVKAIKVINSYEEYLLETQFIWRDSWEKSASTKTEEEYNILKEVL